MSPINGTVQDDILIGTSSADSIFGLNGNDSLDGLEGDDLLDGGNGQDTLWGRDGNDTLNGGNGNDRLDAGLGKDSLTGGRGDDIFVIGKSTGSSTIASADLITDFGKGNDLIELTEGLTFDNLIISQGTGANVDDTVITAQLTGQVLAVLQGVNSSTIDSADFISVPADAETYTFTKIADESGPFFNLAAQAPAINNKGTVVFRANLDSADTVEAGIFTSSGGETTTIADSSGPCSPSIGVARINDGSTVVFRADLDTGGSGIFTSSGGETTTIVNDPFDSFFGLGTINDEGTVVFRGDLDSADTVEAGIFTSSGGETTTIADSSGDPFFDFGIPTINDEGTVVFDAFLDPPPSPRSPDQRRSGIFTSSGGETTTIADSSGLFSGFWSLALNNEDAVAFSASLDTGGSGIFTSSGGEMTTIADSSGLFSGFWSPALNDEGTVAFSASLDTGEIGIFTGPDPIANKVIATGDTLFGSTVTSLQFFNQGLNNLNQLTFSAAFADGGSGIFRADPVLLA